MPVLLQWAKDDGPIQLWEIWREPIIDTMTLIETICCEDVCGFNLAFDWFHLSKIYTTFSLFSDKNAYPEDYINELGELEEQARFVDLCIKPKRAMDIMLHARKGPYQSLMARDDIKIKRVPTALSYTLAEELNKRIVLDDIYFSRSKGSKTEARWRIYEHKKKGQIDPDFKDIKLKFKSSSALKVLAKHALKLADEDVLLHSQIAMSEVYYPEELGYAPFALAVAPLYKDSGYWGKAWPGVIDYHITHWQMNQKARTYATNDVDYTRRLHVYFGSPEPGDTDSELACAVASCRWRGYSIDTARLINERDRAKKLIEGVPHASHKVKQWLGEVLEPVEAMIIQESTKKTLLEEIANWNIEISNNEQEKGQGSENTGRVILEPHPAAIRAKKVLDARKARNWVKLIDKLLVAGRFHASFTVIGTLSSRMSGSDKLNPQGIHHGTQARQCFTLCDPEDRERLLCGGDFKSFEVSLAAKVFDDPDLTEQLLTGLKIHAYMGTLIYPGQDYQNIMDSDGTDNDMYDKGKKGVFLIFYGGDENTFYKKLGIPIEIGKKAVDEIKQKFRGISRFEQQVLSGFQALAQPNGIGTKVEYREPKDYAESFLGFRRYFTLENKICKALFDMAQSPPKSFRNIDIKVVRRDRVQTGSGAVQSAIYGAAFGISSSIIRQVKNHYIQSPGAEITKATQRAIWDIQPSGIHKFLVQPMNVHDEIMNPTRRGHEVEVKQRVLATVDRYKATVPLLAIDWFEGIPNWAAKKG